MSSKPKTTATKEGGKTALVPKLRFPEFRDAEGWEEKLLGDVAPLQRGFDLPSDLIRPGKIPIVYSNGIQKYHEAGMATAPGLVTGRSGTIGKLHFIEAGEYWPHNTSLWVTDFMGNVPRFIYYLYDSIGMGRFSSGSGVPTLNRNDVHAFRSPVPKPPEQQKIAGCLSSVDELIAAQARKLDALKTHKKGLMQQLFPREGETQPRLRFPEFQNAGEWREGSIADIGTVLQGYGFPERHQGLKNGDYPFYKVSDISKSLAAGKVFIEESANYINESLLKELRAKPIPEGTTVFAKIGEAIRSNKRAITTVPCLIDNNAAGVKRIKGRATDFFVYLIMEQISLIEHAGGVVPAVNKSAIEAIPVKFPAVEEQQRIAGCLTSLDALIAAQTQKLEALKTHKKGLMQQLFPSREEVEA
jgi:type I restriction enzyme S subunit